MQCNGPDPQSDPEAKEMDLTRDSPMVRTIIKAY